MTDNVFVKCAEKLGIPVRNSQGSLYFVIGNPDCNGNWHKIDRAYAHQILMLAVLGKMGWGIDSNEDGWWFGSLKYDATGPFPFPALPEAVCKAFLSDKSHGIDTEKGGKKI